MEIIPQVSVSAVLQFNIVLCTSTQQHSCWVETLNLCPRAAIQPKEVDSIQIQDFFREMTRDFLGAINGLRSLQVTWIWCKKLRSLNVCLRLGWQVVHVQVSELTKAHQSQVLPLHVHVLIYVFT